MRISEARLQQTLKIGVGLFSGILFYVKIWSKSLIFSMLAFLLVGLFTADPNVTTFRDFLNFYQSAWTGNAILLLSFIITAGVWAFTSSKNRW